jgi:hypothetical protein
MKCARLTETIDWVARIIGLHHIQLRLLPLANYNVPRNRQCGCHTDWSHHHMCGILMRLGDWKRPRESRRELSTLRVCGLVHLSNFHRLHANINIGASTTSHTTGLSPFSSYYYGVIFNPGICTVDTAFGGTFGIYLPLCSLPDNHPFSHNFSCISNLRVLRGHANYPCCPRVRSSGTISRTEP